MVRGITMPGVISAADARAPAGTALWRAELTETVKLALPIALTQLGQIAMMTSDLALIGRNGSLIPTNMQVDENHVVTSATIANAQWFLEFRPYVETVKVYGVNPGFEWNIGRNLKLDGQLNKTKSEFHRE